jgi:hypothetical protein
MATIMGSMEGAITFETLSSPTRRSGGTTSYRVLTTKLVGEMWYDLINGAMMEALPSALAHAKQRVHQI